MAIRVVIAGGGFGGLETAFSLKALLTPSAEIVLIDRNDYHAFIPSIHLIVSGKVEPEEIRIPLPVVLGAAGIRFVHEEIRSIGHEAREVITIGTELAYDYLVISTGAESNFFDVPGADRFSYRFRSPEDALRIRNELLALLAASAPCNIVVAGAGTEGVEVIGELIDLIRAEGREEELRAGRISITLVEGKKRLLPEFSREVQDRVEGHLRRHGVELIAGDRILEVEKNSITLSSGQKRHLSLLIWSGGIQPSGLVRGLPLQKDPWGWLKVNDFLHVPGDERVYGIGDATSIYTVDGPLALQRLAYHAEDQARIAALNILCHSQGKKQIAYTPKNKPRLISLGAEDGILATDDKALSGPWVVSLKKALERKHLLTYLSKPVSSAIWARVPGARIAQRLRAKLPI